jgi:hypothetical protein
MDAIDHKLHKALMARWTAVYGCATELGNSVDIRPSDSYAVIQYESSRDGQTDFRVKPVVFTLPELADLTNKDFYIVVEGLIALDKQAFKDSGVVRTLSFSTHVAYFRYTNEGFQHMYGAHYDFAPDEVGHPVFHVQLKSFVTLFAAVNEEYGQTFQIADDCMRGVPKRMRIPCAQMDAFSLFLQLIVDHLLWKNSSAEELERFVRLLHDQRNLRGAAFQVARLQEEAAIKCYRGIHWYPNKDNVAAAIA